MRIGRASSLDAAGTTCAQRRRPARRRRACTGSPVGLGEPRELVGGQHPQAELGPAGGDAGLVVGRPPPTRCPAGSARTMSDASRPGSTTTPSASPATATSTVIVRSRSLPVRRQRVAGELGPDARTARAATPPRPDDGPAGGAEGLDEDVTLASELHAGLAFSVVLCFTTKEWW